ncbi:MAG: hypothetical protein U0946_06465 [Patescibacteria group bacterium]|nr:hypothetical protein [Patescibacteria group bacterium]
MEKSDDVLKSVGHLRISKKSSNGWGYAKSKFVYRKINKQGAPSDDMARLVFMWQVTFNDFYAHIFLLVGFIERNSNFF